MPPEEGIPPSRAPPIDAEPEDFVGDVTQEEIDELERRLERGALEAAKEFETVREQEAEAIISDDADDLILKDGELVTLVVNGGKTDPVTGRPKQVRIKVRDPKSPELIVAYLLASESKNKDIMDAATLSLWKACIVEPTKILDVENFKQVTSAARTSINYQLITFLGVDGHFFDQMERLVPPSARRAARRLSTQSPRPTGGIPTKSDNGKPKSSTPATAKPSAAASTSVSRT